MPQQPLGLIAGNGKFPLLFARDAKARKMRVVAVAIKGDIASNKLLALFGRATLRDFVDVYFLTQKKYFSGCVIG